MYMFVDTGIMSSFVHDTDIITAQKAAAIINREFSFFIFYRFYLTETLFAYITQKGLFYCIIMEVT